MKYCSTSALFLTRSLISIITITLPLVPLRADILFKKGEKVAFLGDSITARGGTSGGYVSLVVAGLAVEGVKIEAIQAGIPGNTSNDMLARLDASVLSKHPDWMTLSCGVNDVAHSPGVDFETYKKNITSIVDQVQAKGIKVMIFTSTVLGEELSNAANQKLAAYNDFLRQLAKGRKLPLVDMNVAFRDVISAAGTPVGSILLIDGIHPNQDGNRVMARGILKTLGVPAADFPKMEEVWNAIPGGGSISSGKVNFGGSVSVTLAEYDVIKRMVIARGSTVNAFSNTTYLQAIRQALDAHAHDDAVDMDKLQTEINQAFTQQIKDVIARQSATVTPTKSDH